ncbi:hypothetical protein [Candidatus Methanoperedens nitratireducens]|nr:hypothetical protein [Candidatus Methanoperedens nitroreducens]
MNQADLKEIKDYLRNNLDYELNKPYEQNISKSKKWEFLSLADKNKIDIIGGLPFLLNSTKYFKSINDIKDFSEKFLLIPIPRGNKTRRELIGIIVVGIAELPPKETQRIKDVLNEVMEKVTTGKTDNIFLEWEKAISSIKFQR